MTSTPETREFAVSVGARRIVCAHANIVEERVDAIVNAANATLRGGLGVDGAIHAAAGPGLLQECEGLGGCAAGEARLTGGHRLPSRYVIHAVGPVYRGGLDGEPGQLASAYRASLALARGHGVRSIAFPAISTGAYAYPIERAAPIAFDEIVNHLTGETTIELVRYMLHREAQWLRHVDAFREAARRRGLT